MSIKSIKSSLSIVMLKSIYLKGNVVSVLIFIRVASSLLDRQLARLASDFTQNGGFTENLYAVRKNVEKTGVRLDLMKSFTGQKSSHFVFQRDMDVR